MSKTWLISDTHFGHHNILKFRREDGTYLRNFDSIGEHDEQLIRNWNAVVGYEDTIYHLGDIGFRNFTSVKEVFDRLNGIKVLIKGNHDNFKLSQYAQIFKDVRASHVLDNFILTHIPIHPYSVDRWTANIHGHLHDLVIPDQRYFNVSVERIKYTPINFEVIREFYK